MNTVGHRWTVVAALAACCLPVALAQGQGKPQEPTGSAASNAQTKKGKLTPEERKKLADQLTTKVSTMKALEKRATEVTKGLGELASSGKLPTSDEAIELMKLMLQEMQEIRQSLQKVQGEVEEIKGWIEGQNESMPVLVGDVENLKRATWGNYVQFQSTDTQEGSNSPGGSHRTNNDGLNVRRFRLSTTNRIDPKTSMKLSFDVATGSQRLAAELKDAILTYDIEPSDVEIGKQITFGQQNMGLGYELERSSSKREFPERALYNRTLFAGERNRGVRYRHGLGNGAWFEAGIWQDLTVGDPQQTSANTYRNFSGMALAYTLGLRKAGDHYEVGISTFQGQRQGTAAATNTVWRDLNGNKTVDPGEVTTVNIPATPKNDRRFIFVDFSYVGLLVPQLSMRAEAMWGHDRIPTLNSNGTPVATSASDPFGWHVILTYNLNARNQISYKYEMFDPDNASNDDTVIDGLAYTYWLNPGARFVLAHERVKQQGFDRKDNVTTLRVQFKL